MAQTILVTGGTGVIGGWCIAGLLQRGFQVRATVGRLAKEASLRTMVAAAGVSGDSLTCCAADLTRDEG